MIKCQGTVTTAETIAWRQRTNRNVNCEHNASIQYNGFSYCRKHAGSEALRHALTEGKAQEIK